MLLQICQVVPLNTFMTADRLFTQFLRATRPWPVLRVPVGSLWTCLTPSRSLRISSSPATLISSTAGRELEPAIFEHLK